jgi:MATE family multidrug resistance protein
MSGVVLLMTLVGNAANVVFDYLFIIHWDWASTGAGVSQALSQYLMLVVGIMLASLNIEWKELPSAARKFWDAGAFKAAFTLNGNIFIRSCATMLVMTIFTAVSSAMGTVILTENALLVQVVLLCVYIFEGIGFATETLGGFFKGQQASERLLPLLQVTVGSSILVGLIFAFVCVLFPTTVFGLLTNHGELKQLVQIYVPWLLSVLGFSSVFLILDGYFAGLAEGKALRNAALIAAMFGFAPLAGLAWHSHNNHILWLAMSVWAATRALVLGVQVQKTLKDEPAVVAEQLPDSGIG